jgi:hypothetical protein
MVLTRDIVQNSQDSALLSLPDRLEGNSSLKLLFSCCKIWAFQSTLQLNLRETSVTCRASSSFKSYSVDNFKSAVPMEHPPSFPSHYSPSLQFARFVISVSLPAFPDVKMNHVRSSTVQMRASGSQSDPASQGESKKSQKVKIVGVSYA